MKRNELEFFSIEGGADDVTFSTAFLATLFGIPAAIELSVLFLLVFLIPVACLVGMLNHTDSFMGSGQKLWHRYRNLPSDLKAQVPLSREWIKDSFPLLEHSEQERIYYAVDRLDDIAIAREKEEKRQLVAHKHILTAIEEASAQAQQEVDNLKQINDEGKKMLDAP